MQIIQATSIKNIKDMAIFGKVGSFQTIYLMMNIFG